jgi:signal transduction histidine kinase
MPSDIQYLSSTPSIADVLDSMVEAFYAYDCELRFVNVNRAARARMTATGIDPDSVLGRPLLDVYPSVRGTVFERTMRQVLETRAPAYFTERDLVLGNWLDVRMIPTSDGIATYVHDVSARVLVDRQRDLLLRVGELVSASLDPARTLDAIARAPVPEFADHSVVDLLERDGTVRRVTGAIADLARRPLLDRVLAVAPRLDSESFVAQVLRTGEPLHVATVTPELLGRVSRGGELVSAVRALAPTSLVCVPLLARGAAMGSLLLARTTQGPFTVEEFEVAQEVARRAAAALDHATLYDAERAARTRAERLQSLTAALSRAATAAEVIDAALGEAGRSLGSSTGALCLLDASGREFTLVPGPGMPPDVAEGWGSFPNTPEYRAGEAVHAREPCYSRTRAEFVGTNPRLAALAERLGIGAHAAVPLLVGERVLGALVFNFDLPHDFSAEDDAFLRAVAGQCAQAIERARLYEAERAAREAAESANRVKAEFLAVMSHELRTPLNAIAGYAELISMGIRGPVTAAQREDLERIQKSQRHLLLLINEVLNYARLESGAVTYDLKPTRVASVIDATVPLVEPQRASRLLELVLDVPSDSAVPPALADADKLQQILLNLLSNAVKFTPMGGRVAVTLRALADGRVATCVRDTGVGIPADRLEAIFEPFVQVGRSLSNPGEGTGLGLAISRDLARGMGGELSVWSEVGVGSEFTLVLPSVATATAGSR